MNRVQVTSLLVERLEHIPADSIWAHRASGVRGSLLKMLETMETGVMIDLQRYEKLHYLGFQILEAAAKEKRINRRQIKKTT
jgi:hypothetical protein